jgi:hypothetical protein
MSKEVARYNALAQNAQAQHHHHQLQNSVLVRGRPEILHIIELLVEKIPNDVVELLVEVCAIYMTSLWHYQCLACFKLLETQLLSIISLFWTSCVAHCPCIHFFVGLAEVCGLWRVFFRLSR